MLTRVLTIAGLVMVGCIVWKTGSLLPLVSEYQPPTSNVGHLGSVPGSRSHYIQVAADGETVNAEPWDGTSGIGGMLGPVFASFGFSSPPDLTVCLITLNAAKPHCLLADDGETQSSCVNARSCDWDTTMPSSQAVGIVVFDIDDGLAEGPWDLVDAIIVSDDDNDASIMPLDLAIRAFIDEVAPTEIKSVSFGGAVTALTFNKGERQRRDRALFVLTKSEIANGFRASQSDITITPKP